MQASFLRHKFFTIVADTPLWWRIKTIGIGGDAYKIVHQEIETPRKHKNVSLGVRDQVVTTTTLSEYNDGRPSQDPVVSAQNSSVKPRNSERYTFIETQRKSRSTQDSCNFDLESKRCAKEGTIIPLINSITNMNYNHTVEGSKLSEISSYRCKFMNSSNVNTGTKEIFEKSFKSSSVGTDDHSTSDRSVENTAPPESSTYSTSNYLTNGKNKNTVKAVIKGDNVVVSHTSNSKSNSVSRNSMEFDETKTLYEAISDMYTTVEYQATYPIAAESPSRFRDNKPTRMKRSKFSSYRSAVDNQPDPKFSYETVDITNQELRLSSEGYEFISNVTTRRTNCREVEEDTTGGPTLAPKVTFSTVYSPNSNTTTTNTVIPAQIQDGMSCSGTVRNVYTRSISQELPTVPGEYFDIPDIVEYQSKHIFDLQH